MNTLKMFELVGHRVLVTRGSARAIKPRIAVSLVEGRGAVVLDLSGIDGLTPSFFDETLSVVEECVRETSGKRFRLILTRPPTELSSKFIAVGKVHGLAIKESDNGDWIMSNEVSAT